MEPKEVLQIWIEAFNRADVETLDSRYAESAINHHVANDPIMGREAIKKKFADEFAKANMVCVPEHTFQDGEWAIMEWLDPQGLRGCGFFHVIDNKIILQRGYWDKLSFIKLHNLSDE